jgi:hypothetical protein
MTSTGRDLCLEQPGNAWLFDDTHGFYDVWDAWFLSFSFNFNQNSKFFDFAAVTSTQTRAVDAQKETFLEFVSVDSSTFCDQRSSLGAWLQGQLPVEQSDLPEWWIAQIGNGQRNCLKLISDVQAKCVVSCRKVSRHHRIFDCQRSVLLLMNQIRIVSGMGSYTQGMSEGNPLQRKVGVERKTIAP